MASLSWLAIGGLLLVIYWLYAYLSDPNRRRPANAKAIPSAPGTSLHQLYSLLTRPPWHVMEEWLQRAPIVRFTFLQKRIVMIGDADMVKDLFASKLSNYAKDQGNYAIVTRATAYLSVVYSHITPCFLYIVDYCWFVLRRRRIVWRFAWHGPGDERRSDMEATASVDCAAVQTTDARCGRTIVGGGRSSRLCHVG
jgi:hypothetical protein